MNLFIVSFVLIQFFAKIFHVASYTVVLKQIKPLYPSVKVYRYEVRHPKLVTEGNTQYIYHKPIGQRLYPVKPHPGYRPRVPFKKENKKISYKPLAGIEVPEPKEQRLHSLPQQLVPPISNQIEEYSENKEEDSREPENEISHVLVSPPDDKSFPSFEQQRGKVYKHAGEWATRAPEADSENHTEPAFTPSQLYLQIRHQNTVIHVPQSEALKDAETLEELINAPRLKELARTTHVQEVYSEEGYEDAAYDHGGHIRHAQHGEVYDAKDEGKFRIKEPPVILDYDSDLQESQKLPAKKVKASESENDKAEPRVTRSRTETSRKAVERAKTPANYKGGHKYSSRVKKPQKNPEDGRKELHQANVQPAFPGYFGETPPPPPLPPGEVYVAEATAKLSSKYRKGDLNSTKIYPVGGKTREEIQKNLTDFTPHLSQIDSQASPSGKSLKYSRIYSKKTKQLRLEPFNTVDVHKPEPEILPLPVPRDRVAEEPSINHRIVLPTIGYINSLTTAHFGKGNPVAVNKEAKTQLTNALNLTEALNYLRSNHQQKLEKVEVPLDIDVTKFEAMKLKKTRANSRGFLKTKREVNVRDLHSEDRAQGEGNSTLVGQITGKNKEETEEERRSEELKRREEEEGRRAEELKRREEEEGRRAEELKRREEENGRRVEELKIREEEEKRRTEELKRRVDEQKRRVEEEKRRAEEEKRRIEEIKRRIQEEKVRIEVEKKRVSEEEKRKTMEENLTTEKYHTESSKNTTRQEQTSSKKNPSNSGGTNVKATKLRKKRGVLKTKRDVHLMKVKERYEKEELETEKRQEGTERKAELLRARQLKDNLERTTKFPKPKRNVNLVKESDRLLEDLSTRGETIKNGEEKGRFKKYKKVPLEIDSTKFKTKRDVYLVKEGDDRSEDTTEDYEGNDSSDEPHVEKNKEYEEEERKRIEEENLEKEKYEKALSEEISKKEKDILKQTLENLGVQDDVSEVFPELPAPDFESQEEEETQDSETEATVDLTKYPFYRSKNLPENSALRYASNPKHFPRKSGFKMEFYESRDRIQCPDFHPDLSDLPNSNSTEYSDAQAGDQQRLAGLGDKIACLRSKYFDEEPLDSPIFKEKEIDYVGKPKKGLKSLLANASKNSKVKTLPKKVTPGASGYHDPKAKKNIAKKPSILWQTTSSYRPNLTLTTISQSLGKAPDSPKVEVIPKGLKGLVRSETKNVHVSGAAAPVEPGIVMSSKDIPLGSEDEAKISSAKILPITVGATASVRSAKHEPSSNGESNGVPVTSTYNGAPVNAIFTPIRSSQAVPLVKVKAMPIRTEPQSLTQYVTPTLSYHQVDSILPRQTIIKAVYQPSPEDEIDPQTIYLAPQGSRSGTTLPSRSEPITGGTAVPQEIHQTGGRFPIHEGQLIIGKLKTVPSGIYQDSSKLKTHQANHQNKSGISAKAKYSFPQVLQSLVRNKFAPVIGGAPPKGSTHDAPFFSNHRTTSFKTETPAPDSDSSVPMVGSIKLLKPTQSHYAAPSFNRRQLNSTSKRQTADRPRHQPYAYPNPTAMRSRIVIPHNCMHYISKLASLEGTRNLIVDCNDAILIQEVVDDVGHLRILPKNTGRSEETFRDNDNTDWVPIIGYQLPKTVMALKPLARKTDEVVLTTNETNHNTSSDHYVIDDLKEDEKVRKGEVVEDMDHYMKLLEELNSTTEKTTDEELLGSENETRHKIPDVELISKESAEREKREVYAKISRSAEKARDIRTWDDDMDYYFKLMEEAIPKISEEKTKNEELTTGVEKEEQNNSEVAENGFWIKTNADKERKRNDKEAQSNPVNKPTEKKELLRTENKKRQSTKMQGISHAGNSSPAVSKEIISPGEATTEMELLRTSIRKRHKRQSDSANRNPPSTTDKDGNNIAEFPRKFAFKRTLTRLSGLDFLVRYHKKKGKPSVSTFWQITTPGALDKTSQKSAEKSKANLDKYLNVSERTTQPPTPEASLEYKANKKGTEKDKSNKYVNIRGRTKQSTTTITTATLPPSSSFKQEGQQEVNAPQTIAAAAISERYISESVMKPASRRLSPLSLIPERVTKLPEVRQTAEIRKQTTEKTKLEHQTLEPTKVATEVNREYSERSETVRRKKADDSKPIKPPSKPEVQYKTIDRGGNGRKKNETEEVNRYIESADGPILYYVVDGRTGRGKWITSYEEKKRFGSRGKRKRKARKLKVDKKERK